MTDSDLSRYSHLGLNLPASGSNAHSTVAASSLAAPMQSSVAPQTQGPCTITSNKSSSATNANQRAAINSAPAPVPCQATEQVAPLHATLLWQMNDPDPVLSPWTRIAQLEAELATLWTAGHPVEAENNHDTEAVHESEPQTKQARPLLHLFEDDTTLSHIKNALTIKEENGKKPQLPDIIPGFKANPLNISKHACSILLVIGLSGHIESPSTREHYQSCWPVAQLIVTSGAL